jgi:hypothetical protein
MRKTLVSLGTVAALLLTGSAVRADVINFGYSAGMNVNPVDGSNTIYNSNNAIKTSSVTFMPANGAATYDGSVPTQFIVYNMKTSSTAAAGPGTYDSFSSVPFNLSVTVTDLASSAQQSFVFAGTYNADHVSATSSHVDTTSQGISWGGPLAITQTVGANSYTMSVVSWTAPGAPGSPGSILAEITAQPAKGPPPPPGTGGPPPGTAPEPTSLVLAGLALPALLVARRRRSQVQA